MKTLGIVFLCIAAVAVYGIVHDQITARLCIEYFTIGHPALFGTEDPTMLALGWGILATCWAGLLLGMGLAYAARHGMRPSRTLANLIPPILTLLVIHQANGLTCRSQTMASYTSTITSI